MRSCGDRETGERYGQGLSLRLLTAPLDLPLDRCADHVQAILVVALHRVESCQRACWQRDADLLRVELLPAGPPGWGRGCNIS